MNNWHKASLLYCSMLSISYLLLADRIISKIALFAIGYLGCYYFVKEGK